jgi:hypothetical protein
MAMLHGVMSAVQIVAVVLIAHAMAGCSGSSTAGPSASNGISSDEVKPTIFSISPNTGSIYGGSWVTVVGEIDRSATATIGGIRVSMGWSPTDSTKHILITPPHAAGPADVVVMNSGGASQTVVGGYTYADPGSFDLEGAWAGFTVDGSDTWVEFTVRAHLLMNVRCTDAAGKVVEIAASQPVVNGKIEYVGDAGRFSAWVASASETAGTIDIAPCSGVRRWEATPAR